MSSDSVFTQGQPVYPQDKPSGPSGDSAVAQGVETPPAPVGYEIGGKTYTREQLEEAIQGGLRQADYTRKTQEVAQERRSLRDEYERLEAEKAKLRDELKAISPQGDDPEFASFAEENAPLANYLQRLDQRSQKIERHIEEQARERAQQAAIARIHADREASLSRMESAGPPLFNRDQMREYMVQNDLRPDQVHIAYSALYGSELGRRVGEQEAMHRGATAQPYMGAGQTRVSPAFTGPHDLPGGPKIEGQSWEAVMKQALADPEIPR